MKNLKLKKAIKLTSGVIALLCAAFAVLSVVLFVVVIRGADSVGEALGGIIIFVLAVLAMSVFGATFLLSGIIILANKKNSGGLYIAVTVFGVFDILAVALIIAIGSAARSMGAGWYICLIIPFICDFALRIACTALCTGKKEEQDG